MRPIFKLPDNSPLADSVAEDWQLIPLRVPAGWLISGAMTAIPFGGVVLRWRTAGNWSNSHRLWLAGGILVSHTAFMMPASLVSAAIGLITILLEVILLRALGRRIPPRSKASAPHRSR